MSTSMSQTFSARKPGSSVAHLVLARMKHLSSSGSQDDGAISTESKIPTYEDKRAEIMEMSLNNQRYYLVEGTKVNKPWFRVPRHSFQYSEFVYVTPEMALELLAGNDNTRMETKSQSQAYSRDISTESWIPSAESIGIDVAGNMFDGQHRASAIVQAGKAVAIYVTWNVVMEARFVQDSGRKRNINEKISMVFAPTGKIGKKTPALCRSLMSGTGSRVKWTESEVAHFALAHEDTIRWVQKYVPKQRADVQAVIGKAYLRYGEDKILPFAQNLENVTFPSVDDPANALYRFISKVGVNTPGDVIYRKTVSAINSFIANVKIDRLYESKEDIFQWDVDYTVPNKF